MAQPHTCSRHPGLPAGRLLFRVALAAAITWPASLAPARAGDLGLLEVLEAALANDPEIAVVRADLAAARGSLLAARADFDPNLTSSLEAGRDNGADPAGESLAAAAGASLKLRSGLELESAVALERSAESGPGATSNNGSLSITLRQPLARGRGSVVATAGEVLAATELEAARDDLEQQVAGRLQRVAGLYWDYLSAAENLEILRDTEERSRRFLDNTRRLVEADLTPAADLVQLEANLLSRELSRRAGQRRLVVARQTLGREIGLAAETILELPAPGDPYPPLLPEEAPSLADAAAYIALARENRADLRASRRRLEQSRLRLEVAENALLPRLDLVFTPSYSNSLEGDGADDFFAPLVRDVPGLAGSLGLSFSFSPPNKLARGNLEVRRASLLRAELAIRRIELQIGADVPAAVNEVAFAAEQLAKSLEALELFRRALDNEEKKLRAGSSTLIDVLTQQDQLIAARQQVNDSRLGLALALVSLRFETGTLIESPSADGDSARIALAAFLTLPRPPR